MLSTHQVFQLQLAWCGFWGHTGCGQRRSLSQISDKSEDSYWNFNNRCYNDLHDQCKTCGVCLLFFFHFTAPQKCCHEDHSLRFARLYNLLYNRWARWGCVVVWFVWFFPGWLLRCLICLISNIKLLSVKRLTRRSPSCKLIKCSHYEVIRWERKKIKERLFQLEPASLNDWKTQLYYFKIFHSMLSLISFLVTKFYPSWAEFAALCHCPKLRRKW